MNSNLQALLLDLDGTLLALDMSAFIPVYMQELAVMLAPLIPPETFRDQLMAATQDMINDRNPEVTNEEAFWRSFTERVKQPRRLLEPLLHQFYAERFPLLGSMAAAKPAARRLAETALRNNLHLIIATNPIFPRTAIEHRLRWAGLGDIPFTLITALENMHYCKPHVQYYGEILAKTGLEAGECLMAGNDQREDLAAGELGITTFLVRDHLIPCADAPKADFEGSLDELVALVAGQERS